MNGLVYANTTLNVPEDVSRLVCDHSYMIKYMFLGDLFKIFYAYVCNRFLNYLYTDDKVFLTKYVALDEA